MSYGRNTVWSVVSALRPPGSAKSEIQYFDHNFRTDWFFLPLDQILKALIETDQMVLSSSSYESIIWTFFEDVTFWHVKILVYPNNL